MNKEFEELRAEAQILNESASWWEAESARVMDEVWGLRGEEGDLKKLQELEARLTYLENKGRFEAKRIEEFDYRLLEYFTKRRKECQDKKRTEDE
jgi:predicted  nucleic acid-binding Zn-ribbon protein|tara:strand:+ start:370 stop:654 length:285 start_codon:yes stop_codon:yes gene_type:complete